MGHLLGAALMTVGGLMAAVGGYCTVFYFAAVAGMIADGASVSEAAASGGVALAVGGIPTAIGVAIMMAGWRITQRAD